MFRFRYTKHSKRMLKERDIPKPKGQALYNASRNEKRIIRDSCPKNGCDTRKFIYLVKRTTDVQNQIIIYVCSQIGIGILLLITAFKHQKK